MVYCHECGEQVAENDIFCPHCGISLPPAAAAVEAKKDSLNETADEIADGKTDEFSFDATNESINLKTESVEIPAGINELNGINEKAADSNAKQETPVEKSPEINSQTQSADSVENASPVKSEVLTPAAENLEVGSLTNNLKDDESQIIDASAVKMIEEINLDPHFVSTEGENPQNEINKTESSQTESSLMSYKEAEVKEVLSTDEPDKSVDEVIAEIEAVNPSEQYSSEKHNINHSDAEKSPYPENLGAESEIKTPEFSNMEKRNTGDNIAPIAELPISMPAVELPAEDNCPPSRFDSVSIMEKAFAEEDEEPAKAETPVQESEISSVEKTPEEANEERSFTQPNIGGNDTDGKNKAKLKPLDEGTVLNGRYEIVRKIGGGGMGAVYLASDKNLGGVLRAVKEMVQSYIEDEAQEKAVNDFKRESLLLTSLDHQSIPTIYDYFFDEKEARFYLVMKYISGGDLAGKLRSTPEGRIDETEVTGWAIQIADVLDYLHNRQPPIIYRDLKPANIMIDGNSGRAMLIDFGIARWVNKEEKGVTAIGTMGYAPPELFSGNVEPRSDIYSLGSTLFHLLTGADPQNNPLLIFDFQKHPRPRQINPQLSDQMERILMRAVEYNADKRFASAAEMRQNLEEHLDKLKSGKVTYGIKEAPVSVALSDQPVFCGFCGQKIVATDMFCAFCGAKQPLAQQGVRSEGYAPAALTAQLLIIGTNELEQPAFRLQKEDNLVGRRDPQSNIFPEVDLSKYDPQTKISRRHARIWREGNEFMVEDLGSSNGTFILPVISDTLRLQPHQPQLLTNGDKLKLGDTTLHFILG